MARWPVHRCVLLLALAVVQPAVAGLLHATFQDHAVLQREQPIPVWGATTPHATVTVTLAKSAGAGATGPAAADGVTVHSGADGRWRVTLPPLPAGGPYTLTAVSSSGARQAVTDIPKLIGQVRRARKQGYAIEINEANAHAGCVAAPIIDAAGHCVAAISAVAPEQRLGRANRDRLVAAVTAAAQHLSRRLGHA